MATKKVEQTAPEITITLADAEQIMALYTNVEAADAHYQRCQSDLFREHVRASYKAALVDAAYARLKQAMDVAER